MSKERVNPPTGDRSDIRHREPYWFQHRAIDRAYPPLRADHQTEVLVLGGGITGLSVALELLSRGKRVTVCDANTIGGGTTGRSSAHLDAHPEMGPGALVKQLGPELAATYTAMRLDAIERIEQRCGDACDFRRVPGYFYTENEDRLDKIRRSIDDAKAIGLSVTWQDSVPIAKAVGGYRVEMMARVDIFAYLQHLASLVAEAGGTIFEQTLVPGIVESHPASLKTSGGEIQFDQVVSAIHCNYTNSQRLYVQTPPYQSYVIAAKVRTPLPDALFWDDSDPYFYVRRATADGGTILAGGKDHRTGAGDESVAMNELETWIRERFDVEEVVSRWSAELFEPADGLPFIGKVAGKENVWITTGLSGVGLTLGTAAGPMLADLMEGKAHPLEKTLSPARVPLRAAGNVLAEQAASVADFAERLLPAKSVDVSALASGEGAVGNVDGKHTAVCRDRDGCLRQLSPICTHMGGVLRWNEVEQTWDCPVHGGRFAADGARLYGPPEDDLDRIAGD
ncbi:MAG: FAD-dependent oxidoreductase [Phycisphaera sp. RhM]|nr:FAD-dependent oxidoreductase [Phycisphaera sp. RhM]